MGGTTRALLPRASYVTSHHCITPRSPSSSQPQSQQGHHRVAGMLLPLSNWETEARRSQWLQEPALPGVRGLWLEVVPEQEGVLEGKRDGGSIPDVPHVAPTAASEIPGSPTCCWMGTKSKCALGGEMEKLRFPKGRGEKESITPGLETSTRARSVTQPCPGGTHLSCHTLLLLQQSKARAALVTVPVSPHRVVLM